MTSHGRRACRSRALPPGGVAAAFVIALSACDGGDGTVDPIAGAPSSGSTVVPLPPAVLQSRAIDRGALEVEVEIDGEVIEAVREGDAWTVTATVPPGQALALEVTWFELVGEARTRLPIASLVDALEPLGSNADVTIDPARYSIDAFDADRDGVPNLVERERGTGAEDPADPGRAAPPDDPFVIPRIDTSVGDAVTFDGEYESAWNQAEFQLVDTLLIGGDPGNPRAQGYSWGAMHDGESLYLIVRFEGEGGVDERTPANDPDQRFNENDALNLFIDPDHARGEFLSLATSGGDDRYLVFPLPPDAVETPPMPLTPFDEPANRVENLPDSLVHGVASGREAAVAGWEIRLSLAELGLTVGEPFGIELHLDQDLGGGPRDERWAWAYPSRLDREAAGAPPPYNFESPARFGTAVLAPPSGDRTP